MAEGSVSHTSGSGDVISTKTTSTKVEEERPQWNSQAQFILTALGLAVGLGNIWRFPYVAYENGGAAFLIPYLTCALLFGLPMLYGEFMIGQYSRSGPGLATGRYAAGLRGIGWAAVVNSITLSIYYCVIIAWCGVYFVWVVSGQSWKWTECNNDWNTPNCVHQHQLKNCQALNASKPYYWMGNCTDVKPTDLRSPTEEFFVNYMTIRSNGINEFGGMNWPVFFALLFLWVSTCLILLKGVKAMGYLSFVIVPFPYIIVCILFIRGITLEGSFEGIKYYLLNPDFNKLLTASTWASALKQLMFSMNIGYGGLISLSSYSKPDNNFFRDCLIVIFGDTIMSVVGGVAVFSVLGYLSQMTGKSIPEVVDQGASLAFIVYPEAISTMTTPYIWNSLFFMMLFFLGISSEIALVEVFTGLIFDCFPSTRKRGWVVTVITCTVCFLGGLLFCFHSGWFWFNLADDFMGSVCSCLVAAGEVILLTIYGWKQVKQDLDEMRGEPRCTGWKRWFGNRSPIFGIFWATICPTLALLICGQLLVRTVPFTITLDKHGSTYTYPAWAETLGWIINLGTALPIPGFLIWTWWQFRREGMSFCYLFRPTKELRSYSRYYQQKGIPPPDELVTKGTFSISTDVESQTTERKTDDSKIPPSSKLSSAEPTGNPTTNSKFREPFERKVDNAAEKSIH